ncbi:hypothetical protein DHEL01_v210946 [Diaporthe helianthi]|uniref:Methyltransferase domain-containing protein n=1 Tax=Diaporthe helianthi TaxID=158607 RepID=A0A2P5HK81_DIAHE|nr:hypothetical protein DHEL01_v210946 [Diaporthe helianthi]
MDDNHSAVYVFGQPQPGLEGLGQDQQPDGSGSSRAAAVGSGVAMNNPSASPRFEPFITGATTDPVPALNFNGASVAEPDAVMDEENGRTYHNYHEGRYYLPNDAAEQDRLDLQHKLWQVHLDGALFKAPIHLPPKNVLDVATGTGIWAIQMAKTFPESNVIGTDLSLIQPEDPPNCSFIKEDAELDEWTLPAVFDYIHLRMIHTCFDDYAALFRKCYENLEPGGNPWPDEAKFKSLGYWQMINSHRALRGFGWKLFRKLGMEPDAIEELVEKAKTDITDSSLHFFFPIYVVCGRKPYEWELGHPPQKRMRT